MKTKPISGYSILDCFQIWMRCQDPVNVLLFAQEELHARYWSWLIFCVKMIHVIDWLPSTDGEKFVMALRTLIILRPLRLANTMPRMKVPIKSWWPRWCASPILFTSWSPLGRLFVISCWHLAHLLLIFWSPHGRLLVTSSSLLRNNFDQSWSNFLQPLIPIS